MLRATDPQYYATYKPCSVDVADGLLSGESLQSQRASAVATHVSYRILSYPILSDPIGSDPTGVRGAKANNHHAPWNGADAPRAPTALPSPPRPSRLRTLARARPSKTRPGAESCGCAEQRRMGTKPCLTGVVRSDRLSRDQDRDARARTALHWLGQGG